MGLGRLVSRALVIAFLWATGAAAHEVNPSNLFFTTEGDTTNFTLRANVEGLLAGIDLSEVADTNEAAEAEDYDALRALPPEEIAARWEAFWPEFASNLKITVDGTPVTPEFTGITVPEVGDVELVRTSVVTFTVPAGETMTVGWDKSYGQITVLQEGVDAPYNGLLMGGEVTPEIALAGGSALTPWESFVQFVPVGIDHIVPLGLDHILFVLGLFFLAARVKPLLWQVTAFTLAHTITLALAALDIVPVNPDIVEPLIALSIVYVAVENIFQKDLPPWRPFVIFAFGLLHGLGFSIVLADFMANEAGEVQNFIPALIGFNIGVELGQLLVISVAFLCVWLALRVDRGENLAHPAEAIYAVLFLVAAGIAVWSYTSPETLPDFLVVPDDVPTWIFAGPLAALFALSGLSCYMRDEVGSYRRFVAVPASAAIAVVGLWWVIERTLL